MSQKNYCCTYYPRTNVSTSSNVCAGTYSSAVSLLEHACIALHPACKYATHTLSTHPYPARGMSRAISGPCHALALPSCAEPPPHATLMTDPPLASAKIPAVSSPVSLAALGAGQPPPPLQRYFQMAEMGYLERGRRQEFFSRHQWPLHHARPKNTRTACENNKLFWRRKEQTVTNDCKPCLRGISSALRLSQQPDPACPILH